MRRDGCGLMAGDCAVTRSGRIHCFLDGREVTATTRACCVIGGWIDLCDLTDDGRKFIRGGSVAITRHYGHIEVSLDPEAS